MEELSFNEQLLSSSVVLANEGEKEHDLSQKDIIETIRAFCERLSKFFRQHSDNDYTIKKLQDLQNYKDFLEDLASNQSSNVFSNGGIEYASILMSVLFNNTKKIARVYSHGFKPELITTEPYWSSLKNYIANPYHTLYVLVQTNEYVNAEPLMLLKKAQQERKRRIESDEKDNIVNKKYGDIIVKMISEESKDRIIEKYGEECNFAVFDDNKFRYEYDPRQFKAYGSFNQPDNCQKLKDFFDEIFFEDHQTVEIWER